MTTKFEGARWWSFDFHAHTPASCDYGKGKDREQHRAVTPCAWLLDFMGARIDCVAVTDHNSGKWIGALQAAYGKLVKEAPENFRPLVVFPGVEITVHAGYHVLAILDPGKGQDDVTSLLSALKIPVAEQGTPDALSPLSITGAVEKIREHDGLAIPAHVDRPGGIFFPAEAGATALKGQSLAQLLRSEHVLAAEVKDADFRMPGAYFENGTQWARVLGSDSHHPTAADIDPAPGGRHTWVKMGAPSLEGLRLALLDREPLSIMRSDDSTDDPNRRAGLYIEEVEIGEGKYVGRGQPLRAGFSPWLSAVIGGRGTGKSTLIEMMRLALRRETDRPDELNEELRHFQQVPESGRDRGALTTNTEVKLTLSKEGERFRLRWRHDGTEAAPIERWEDGSWRPSPGEVAERFKVTVLSQKQVFAMARDAASLLRVIDESAQVRKSEWTARHDERCARFLALRSRVRALEARLANRQRLQGELADVQRQLAIFEESGHREVLVQYRRLARQRRAVDDRHAEFGEAVETVRRASETVASSDLAEEHFALGVPAEAEGLELLRKAAASQNELSSSIRQLADRAAARLAAWETAVGRSAWARLEGETRSAYRVLVERLKEEGDLDPSSYGHLVRERQSLERDLEGLAAVEEELRQLEDAAERALRDVERLRLDLSERREQFLADVLRDNDYVRIEVVPFGEEPLAAEPGFREAIGRHDGRLRGDILAEDGTRGMLADLYREPPEDAAGRRKTLASRVARLKREILAVRQSGLNQWTEWFGRHVRNLASEQLDRLELWWPDDELRVEYRRAGESRFTPIAQGSPGQKSAAMLAFLLSHGDEPIILDQPEDDLDNRLISDLVVEQVRQGKRDRQIIVATHNPNIVVNGDAEMVLSMAHRHGQCRIEKKRSGCLQDREVRSEICDVMEGGQEAFENRYRRLHEEFVDVY